MTVESNTKETTSVVRFIEVPLLGLLTLSSGPAQIYSVSEG